MNRRQFLVSASAAAFMSGLPAFAAQAGTLTPPIPAVRPKRIEQLGRVRTDNYAWLRDPNYSAFLKGERPLDPEIEAHLNAENAYADQVMIAAQAWEGTFAVNMMAMTAASDPVPSAPKGGFIYYTYVRPGEDHLVHARKPAGGGDEQVLLDEQARSRGQSYYRVIEAQISPDHSLFVWAEDLKGSDRHRICVHDLKTGEIRSWEDGYGWSGLTVSADSQWVFWIWRDPYGRPAKVYRANARGPVVQTLIYEEKDPALFVSIGRMASDAYNFIHISGPDVDEWRLIPADAPTAAPQLMQARNVGLHYEVCDWNGKLVITTDADGAVDGKLMTALPGQSASDWQAFRPYAAGTHILSVTPFKDHLVIRQRRDGKLEIVVMSKDGKTAQVAFDEPAYDVTVADGQVFYGHTVRLIYQSPRTPPHHIDYDMATGTHTVVTRQTIANFDPEKYEVRRLMAPAPDGETVPLTVLMRTGTKLNGQSPLLIYGYGAYGLSSEAEFSIPALALVNEGFIYAIAHVRGGSEKGRNWFLNGRRFKKANSFTDFNACADYLIKHKYTRKRKIVAYGLSAGGLLVGGAMNLRPDLYAGVIAQVPFVDMLNTMSDDTHPLVPAFRPDWGDPLTDPVAYDYIAAISPYENVRKAAYPMVLATAGVRDDRVSYWEAAKWVANLRVHTTSDKPILFKVNMTAGHQSASGLSDIYAQMATFWAFAQLSVYDA
ncbi:prolyl oligopeptidase family serine peptidase [Asticcacaulis sp. SL142]|uniref:S9 family peptidase n=1 Tax=Asticcacaulis sp. SL142 TaxID=2995155 RepID=UPI00226C881B|nr:prolyl oligopeptidase family serine peptidase [Asticcacaulis sp. SL142]WAC48001.1 prolyl oligopeptidase family serine peptidase [Asticcacaulis sp. SL142]